MGNFSELKYERPYFEKVKSEFEKLITDIQNSKNAEQQLKAIKKINKIRNFVQTKDKVSKIRHSIDTTDNFYRSENRYWDEHRPLYDSLAADFYRVLLASEFRCQLEEKISPVFFSLAENSLKTFSVDIIADLQQENKLVSEYMVLISTAKTSFRGEMHNLASFGKYTGHPNREIREAASRTKWQWYADNEQKLDNIFDQLVKVRHCIARKLGFNNFVELSYVRLNRLDYDAGKVEAFRKQVLESIVPVANEIFEQQRMRLGLKKMRHFDLHYCSTDGNARPQGNTDWIIQQSASMFNSLSPETKNFFNRLKNNNFMDLENKPNKKNGGFCAYLPDEKMPFLFANFKGTKNDVRVLTHEMGHGFQKYMSRWIETPELLNPTQESAEIHAMSMELLTYPWMELFFGKDTLKFKHDHLSDAITTIPYIATVDAFQHWVYEHPEAFLTDRKTIWRQIEKQFQPHKEYGDFDFLESGGFWMVQSHIFSNPFYYIDYALAQVCALQFWKKMNENYDEAWKGYLELCKLGGTKSFLELLKHANLASPFEQGAVNDVVKDVSTWLRMNPIS